MERQLQLQGSSLPPDAEARACSALPGRRPQTKAGSLFMRGPMAPIVRLFIRAYVSHMLASRREVKCRMLTVSQVMDIMGIR